MIDEMLYRQSPTGWRKQELVTNADKSFQGSFILGRGFTMTPDEAQALIAKDPRNADVLFPYLGGEDINQSPTQTAPWWVINFFDWQEENAREYADCFEIVERLVRPDREKLLSKSYATAQRRGTYWWLYGGDSKSLYRAVAGLESVIALCRVSKSVAPAIVPTGQVFSDATIVFLADYFAVERLPLPLGMPLRILHAERPPVHDV